MQPTTPTIPTPPLSLADSWLDGYCDSTVSTALAVKRTQNDLKAAGVTEAQARAIRNELQEVFERWRTENPTQESSQHMGGLLGTFGTPMGEQAEGYAELQWKLHGEKYTPLEALSTRYRESLDAVLVLAEAAAGRFESARQVRELMDWVWLPVERDRARALTEILKDVLPAAEKYWNVKGGPGKRQHQKDKRNFIALAKPRRGEISTVTALENYAELVFFVGKYKTETLRDWLKAAGIELKPGRPKKN